MRVVRSVVAVGFAPVAAAITTGLEVRTVAAAAPAWTDTPNAQQDRFPEGRCECGHDLTDARDPHEQGLSARRWTVEEIFTPDLLDT